MEKLWKVLRFSLGLLLCQLCNGLPINSENTVEDPHTQLLTGLVAVLLTICSVVFLAGCLCCQRKNGFKEFRDSPVVASTVNLDYGHINPVANGEFTIFTPLSPPHQNNNVFLANQQRITRTQEDYTYGDVDVSSWFNGSESDFPRIKLKYIKELGKGWFGRVVEGAAQDIDNNQQRWSPVVVRILETTATSRERVVFLHDASIYRCGAHPNILKLLGRCLDTIPLLILQEYCPQGDLKRYLLQNQGTADKLLSTEYPLVWCCQLTSALKHLHDHKITHPDLAARNCQLTSNLTLKLGDYGLAVFQYPEDYYEGAPGLPLRWCAPETLSYTSTTIQPKKVTLESNVWSLAVTMWEIYSCGEQPYSALTHDEVIAQVLGSPKVRLKKPTCQVLYIDYIFRLMELCWTSSESRPAVSQVDLMLTDLLQVYKNTSTTQIESTVLVKDFDRRWESFKPNSIVKTDNHITDSTSIDIEDLEIAPSKPLSPSLNNLHGSLDSLLQGNTESQMESWLENVANKTGDMSFVKGLSEAIKDLDNALALENSSSSNSSPATEEINPKLEFKLGPLPSSKAYAEPNVNQIDSLTDSMLFIQRNSSGSETEEENWKNKIQRGAYTEKVRQKSRSVADLMVLTHIDQSESENETPLASLEYRSNYKNVRYAPKSNLENASVKFGSEGNLLNVHDTFGDELKKLQEERRDSLLFVPETHSQTSDSNLINHPQRILEELNSPSEIQPPNQVFNVFNVTVDKFSSIHSKLSEFINFKEVPKLSDIIQSNSELVSYLNENPFEKPEKSLSDEDGESCDNMYDSGVEGDKGESTESLRQDSSNLPDLVKDSQEQINGKLQRMTKDQISRDSFLNSETCSEASYKNSENDFEENIKEVKSLLAQEIDAVPQQLENSVLENGRLAVNSESSKGSPSESTEPSIVEGNIKNIGESVSDNLSKIDNDVINSENDLVEAINETIIDNYCDKRDNYGGTESSATQENGLNDTIIVHKPECKKYQVPKLMDLIQDNDELMDYIIAKYESENLDNTDDNFDSLEEVKDFDAPVAFDVSETQEEAKPNSLTHSNCFTSTPFGKKNFSDTMSGSDDYSSLNLFGDTEQGKSDEMYSLETWDNFLGKALDKNETEGLMFDSFSSEPQSMLFIENEEIKAFHKDDDSESRDTTYTCDKRNSTFSVDVNDIQVKLDDENVKIDSHDTWESQGGWFLHPQSNSEDVSGEMTVAPGTSSDSYVGFNMDDEIMAAIRTELLTKLPQAQVASSGSVDDEEEWDSAERNEVFLRYNVYNTPLSPIPEESIIEDYSCESTPRQGQSEDEDSDSDWSEHCEREILHPEEVNGSPIHPGPMHRHTPSQDSCCSNDTLFNLEELTCAVNDADRENSSPTFQKFYADPDYKVNHQNNINSESGNKDDLNGSEIAIKIDDCAENSKSDEIKAYDPQEATDKTYIAKFLNKERECSAHVTEPDSLSETLLSFLNQQVAPLPSPEDKPWKQLPASLLTYNNVISQNMLLPASESKDNVHDRATEPLHDVENNIVQCHNVTNIEDIVNEADYVNIANLENTKNSAEFLNKDDDQDSEDYDADDYEQDNTFIINSHKDDEKEMFGVLTDIRFNGPGDQLMSTSFSESNDLNDDQDWDSGSDTRSSSSGEFIWKEGEHEESLKALRAAPQDVFDDIKPMEEIQEETCSESSGSDEDGENPEFVPSAWDKYATPTKSALRSPEKILERTDTDKKKAKGVWFKKQKYHCVYEYPREPESPVFSNPVLNNFSLWNAQQDYSPFTGDSGMDEFYISSSAKPFDMIGGLTSQFFPGDWSTNQQENATPDSGVEDVATPLQNLPQLQVKNVPSLKHMASEVVNRSNKYDKRNDKLGGLRHTRDRLKLDLPPSPSAFTSSKIFNLEQEFDPVTTREKPAFTTFGKSRFLVQHVETPPDDDLAKNKNVSFEALPYKPIQTQILSDYGEDKKKIESVRGEASLLDSADEDSGIESSTLERKLSND